MVEADPEHVRDELMAESHSLGPTITAASQGRSMFTLVLNARAARRTDQETLALSPFAKHDELTRRRLAQFRDSTHVDALRISTRFQEVGTRGVDASRPVGRIFRRRSIRDEAEDRIDIHVATCGVAASILGRLIFEFPTHERPVPRALQVPTPAPLPLGNPLQSIGGP